MTLPGTTVKDGAGPFKSRWLRFRDWIDSHPRTGWYVAVVVTVDLVLQVMQALG